MYLTVGLNPTLMLSLLLAVIQVTNPKFPLPIPKAFGACWAYGAAALSSGVQCFALGGCCGARAIPAQQCDHLTPLLTAPLAGLTAREGLFS